MSSNELPDEILLHIFRQLPVKDLPPLRLVSHRWRRVINDSSLYGVIHVNGDDSKSAIVTLLKLQKNSIRHLHITERADLNTLAPFIVNCTKLQTFSLKLCNSDGDDLLKIIECNRNLTTVVLQYSTYTSNISQLFTALSRSAVKNINMRSLNHDIETYHLADLRGIEDLRFKGIQVDSEGAYIFCLNNSHCLTTLKLCPTDWLKSPSFEEKFFTALSKCERLKTLCLGPEIAHSMNDTTFSSLMTLDLLSVFEIHRVTNVSVSSFEAFFGRPSARNLRKISLFGCTSVTNAVLRLIANRCPDLEKFTLEKTKETRCDEDVEDVITFVRNCKRLRNLNLFNAHISVCEILHDIPKYLPRLRSLKYHNKHEPMKTPSLLYRLEKLMPQFEVSGLQWKFGLYVHCKKKVGNEQPAANDLVCARNLKAYIYP